MKNLNKFYIYAITNMNISSNEEGFVFSIHSGIQIRQYIATPKHTKRIFMLLQKQIEEHENKFGEIKTKLPEKINNTKEESKVGF